MADPKKGSTKTIYDQKSIAIAQKKPLVTKNGVSPKTLPSGKPQEY